MVLGLVGVIDFILFCSLTWPVHIRIDPRLASTIPYFFNPEVCDATNLISKNYVHSIVLLEINSSEFYQKNGRTFG